MAKNNQPLQHFVIRFERQNKKENRRNIELQKQQDLRERPQQNDSETDRASWSWNSWNYNWVQCSQDYNISIEKELSEYVNGIDYNYFDWTGMAKALHETAVELMNKLTESEFKPPHSGCCSQKSAQVGLLLSFLL